MYTDYYDLFERFSIMTVDSGVDDKTVLNILKNKTTPELYIRLVREVKNGFKE